MVAVSAEASLAVVRSPAVEEDGEEEGSSVAVGIYLGRAPAERRITQHRTVQ